MTTTKLAAFDLDGTLLRGDTVCEAIARGLGRLDRMLELEGLGFTQLEQIRAGREEMASWYAASTAQELCSYLDSMHLAPGAREGLGLLKEHGFKIAIVSITWEFAVEWFANRLGADYFVGTRLSPDGVITHFLPEDKPTWLQRLATDLGAGMDDVVAVGDSGGDTEMLLAGGHPYWVGTSVPKPLMGKARHLPDGDILEIARQIVARAT